MGDESLGAGWIGRFQRVLLGKLRWRDLLISALLVGVLAAGAALAERVQQSRRTASVLLSASAEAAPVNLHVVAPAALANVECASCHALPRALAGSDDVLPSTKEACLQCHTQQKQQLAYPSTHPPFKGGECTACHRVHPPGDGSQPALALLKAPVDKLCFSCHGDKRQQSEQAAFQHVPFATGKCTSCHDPHATTTRPTLKAPVPELCFTCHRGVAQTLNEPVLHPPFETGNCTSCHSPHASNQLSQLRAPTQQVCFSCHAGPMARADPTHKPVREGWCTSCHTPHGSKNVVLLRAERGQLCLSCHRK